MVAVAGAFAGAVLILVLSFYIAWRTHKEYEQFIALRKMGLALGYLLGTDFRGATLTNTVFSHTILKGCRFTDAKIKYTCFLHAKKAELARFSNK